MANENGHWYTRDGKPCHQRECKTAPGKFRSITIKDARELDLVPSVTSILDIVHRFALTEWRRRETVRWAVENEPQIADGESLDSFAARIVDESDPYLKQAADLGTQVHDAIENLIRNPKYQCDEAIRPHVEQALAWWDEQNFREVDLEYSFSSSLGYGGKIDVVIGRTDIELPAIIDWKTGKSKPNQAFEPWPSYGAQLAAYAHGIDLPDAELINVMISTTEPGRIHVHRWEPNEISELWRSFLMAFELWKSPLGKGYNPNEGEPL